MRYYLIDKIEEYCPGKHIAGVKCITLADDVFNDHFPGHPIFPGSLLTESLAQLGGVLFNLMLKEESSKRLLAILSVINSMKFRKPVFPGDRLQIKASIISKEERYGFVKVEANNGDITTTTGELSFVFAEVEDQETFSFWDRYQKVLLKDARIIE